LENEKLLVERARSGEIAAFRELVEQHKKKIYYLALDLTGNHHDAEDLSQEVFIQAYRSLAHFRGESKLSSWLYRIAVNTNINKHRKKSLRAMKLGESLDEMKQDRSDVVNSGTEADPEARAEAGVMQMHIERALGGLTPRERSVFVLRHYNDLPLKEIAQTLKISKGTVKSTLFRAIRRLQKELSFYREDMGLEYSNE